METYIIINGTEATVISANDKQEAKIKAENICNHSKEIIVREITNIDSLLMHINIL